ncbi:hypothetical protein M1506_00480 [Patescibacteria group bacterium]|nr:hypothetical protein [Patescibacteria group bacterium]
MKKSISSRVKITKSGKVVRRAMALGHSRANKRTTQIKRKKGARILEIDVKKIKNN